MSETPTIARNGLPTEETPAPPAGTLPLDSPRLLPVAHVAKLLAASERAVHRWSDAGVMPPPVKIGGAIRWPSRTGDPATGLFDWIESGCPKIRRPRVVAH